MWERARGFSTQLSMGLSLIFIYGYEQSLPSFLEKSPGVEVAEPCIIQLPGIFQGIAMKTTSPYIRIFWDIFLPTDTGFAGYTRNRVDMIRIQSNEHYSVSSFSDSRSAGVRTCRQG